VPPGTETAPPSTPEPGPAPDGNRRGSKRQTFSIPVSNGIFDHREVIRDAVWLFLWYIDKTTKEKETSDAGRVGLILGGMPIRDSDVAATLRYTRRTICIWRNRLQSHGYIRTKRTPHGYVIEVTKSKKWSGKNSSHHSNEAGNLFPSDVQVDSQRCTKLAHVDQTVQEFTETKKYPPTPQGVFPGGFDAFWEVYPRRVAKGTAEKAWLKIKPDSELQQKILAAIKAQKRSDQWQREEGRFIPHPATWLKGAQWDDEPAEALLSLTDSKKLPRLC